MKQVRRAIVRRTPSGFAVDLDADEVEALVDDHYLAEAQTPTTGAEATCSNSPSCAAG